MAYAAVISLNHNIEQLMGAKINPQIRKSACDNLNYIKQIFEKLDTRRRYQTFDVVAINALDAQIRDAVWKLEDALESSHSLPPPHRGGGCEQEIDSFIQTAAILGSHLESQLHHPLMEEEDEPIVNDDFGLKKSTTIGSSGGRLEIERVINGLLDPGPELKTVALAGMAGIGKTHFAKEIYQHPKIVENFDFKAWVWVGKRREEEHIFMDILAQIEGKPRNLYLDKSLSTLTALLKRVLCDRRCLIVLDDIWSDTLFTGFKQWFPVDGVRRVLLTTRVGEVYECRNSMKIQQVQFLSNDESWNLLWRSVFVDTTSFPAELEKVGRKIAEKCEGLPLLILAVAQILRGLDKTEEQWKKVVAERKDTTFENAYDKIYHVLNSSYDYLPQHLKACFLYNGVFPRSCEIRFSKLVDLLAVESFVEPEKSSQALEAFAAQCVEKLVSNSLVIVCRRRYDDTINSCKLHSAYWYLCVKEARKGKFLQVLNRLNDGEEEHVEGQRRLSFQNSILFGIKDLRASVAAAALGARSLLCTGVEHPYPVPICLDFTLLKVLDALSIRLYEFPEEAVNLLLLKYLALTHNGKLPPSISNLQHLQFLIISQHHNIKFVDSGASKRWDTRGQRSTKLLRDQTSLPKEIWDMQELKHLRVKGLNLPDPSARGKLPNLLTLCVNARSCTKPVFKSIPYLKKLGIRIELQPDAAEALSCFKHVNLLRELESLKCVILNPSLVPPPDHLSNLPASLKKLSLKGLGYSWNYMKVIGSLPNLRVLKLRFSAFRGAEWVMNVGEFQRLEFLMLEDIDVVEWTSYDDDCFPRLHCLVIRDCYRLKEIPQGIPTLQKLAVVDCSPSMMDCAHQVYEDRNCRVQVAITSSWNL